MFGHVWYSANVGHRFDIEWRITQRRGVSFTNSGGVHDMLHMYPLCVVSLPLSIIDMCIT